jgi:hypothetical protein
MSAALLAALCLALASAPSAAQRIDAANLAWMQDTLARWEQACREDLRIPPQPLPWIVFFDESRAWHVSPEIKRLPPHRRTRHSLRFSRARYRIYEVDNAGGALWLPDRNPIPIKAQGFAVPYDRDTKTLFLLAVPSLQAKAAGVPWTADLAVFFAGSALHELAHTRQLPHIMPLLRQWQSRHKSPRSIDDNLIENTFSSHPEFVALRAEAGKHLTAAVLATEDAAAKAAARNALAAIRALHRRFFTGEYQGWNELEEIFLTLEGAAMMVQFQYSRRLAPQEDWRQTLGLLMQRSDSWSQSDGLALFLLIARFDPQWPARFFANAAPPSPLAVLDQLLGPAPSP